MYLSLTALLMEGMLEEGIDISQSKPKLSEKMIDVADLVILTDATLEEKLSKNLWKKMDKKFVTGSIPDSARSTDGSASIRLRPDQKRNERTGERKGYNESPYLRIK